jgi:hypothetical protein
MPELLWTGRAGKKLTNHTRGILPGTTGDARSGGKLKTTLSAGSAKCD